MINSLLDEHHSKKATFHYIATSHLTPKQYLKIKSLIVNINNHLNKIFPAFDSLSRELSPSFCFVDTFLNCFSFHLANQKDVNIKITHQNKLKNIYETLSNSQDTILIISDTSVKNNIAILVSYIWRRHEIIAKTDHHVMNILLIEALIFAIRHGISQVSQMQGVTYIVIIIDAIYTTKCIFNISIYSYQLYTITISVT